jgi:thiol-disulfide isomerase/thioredoxin
MIKKTGKISSLLIFSVLSLLLIHNVLTASENKSDSIKNTPTDDAKLAEPRWPHPLLAKPAPSFKLELLNGGEFDLSQQKDKNIVILDFWAIWCGPCRSVMPIMEEVANEYKDKGVILIAVNLRESPQAIRSFLQEQGLHPIVALDRDGAVGNIYRAEFIPQTVIIGKDGIVQAVHVGALRNLKEILKKELDDLLAGKKLVSIKKTY